MIIKLLNGKAAKLSVLLLMSLFFVACTSTKVKPLESSAAISNVAIKFNAEVAVKDFLPVIKKGFAAHGITTQVYKNGVAPANSQAILTYTALRSWDMAAYLSHAELKLSDKHNKELASAIYHLNGKGGMSLTKWGSVESKMLPVIDKLLAQYGKK